MSHISYSVCMTSLATIQEVNKHYIYVNDIISVDIKKISYSCLLPIISFP